MGLEGRLDVLEEGDGEAVALVDVGEVAIESCFGVLIGEEAGVGEFPTEDWELSVKKWERGKGRAYYHR